jgi:ribulose-phosphate 3-epimerase
MIKIAPSILSADFARMGDEVRSAKDAGADWLHIDVMDGHFCPNLTMGPDMVKAVRKVSDLFLDVHLMVTNPEDFFESFARAGADQLVFHIEVDPDPTDKIKMIRALGCRAGLSLNPDHPVPAVLPFLEQVDLVLLMSVFPGFSGQKFIPESLDRAAELKTYIGGVDRANAQQIINAGVDVTVMGSAFFGTHNRGELVQYLKSLKAAEL